MKKKIFKKLGLTVALPALAMLGGLLAILGSGGGDGAVAWMPSKHFFTGYDSDHGEELWATDGTASGTRMVLDIYTTGTGGSWPDNFTWFDNEIYFTAADSVHGQELWKSDGTAEGTTLVKDIYAGTLLSFIMYLTPSKGALYFQAKDEEHGTELWRTDGTEAGTRMVLDIYTSASGSPNSSWPQHLANFGDDLVFMANDGLHGYEPWITDGTAEGTTLLKDINPGGGASNSDPDQFTEFNNDLYFVAAESIGGTAHRELWRSDGTTDGTQIVKDIYPGSTVGSHPGELTAWNGALYFSAYDAENGRELWKTDGTTNGTVMVFDIYTTGNIDSNPQYFTPLGNALYFTATDSVHGDELWKTDGTAEGTQLVKDINAGAAGSGPVELTVMNGVLYFVAGDATDGRELWKSDGTEAGTVRVSSIAEGVTKSTISYLTVVDGKLYFFGSDGLSFNFNLWKTDGTREGTENLTAANALADYLWFNNVYGDDFGNTIPVIRSGGKKRIVFGADDGTHGYEPWASDGTVDGTGMLMDIYPDAGCGYGGCE